MSDISAAARGAGERIEELETIRGLAALLIVFHHIPNWNASFFEPALLRNAWLMVDLFFVLSGFVIHQAYATRIRTGRELARFQFLRLARLYPVHLLFLAVMVAIETAKYLAQAKFGVASPNSVPFQDNNAAAFAQHLLLVQGLGPGALTNTFNVPAWSISVELYTYLLFGVTVLLAGAARDRAFLVLTAGAGALLMLDAAHGFDFLLRCVFGFFLGCLIGRARQAMTWRPPAGSALVPFLALVAYLSAGPIQGYSPVVSLLTCALILTIATGEGGALGAALRWRGFTWLGALSYSIYMSHTAVLWVANQTLRMVFRAPEALIEGKSTPQLSLLEAALAYGAILACILALSWFVYTFVESPLRSASRRVSFGARVKSTA